MNIIKISIDQETIDKSSAAIAENKRQNGAALNRCEDCPVAIKMREKTGIEGSVIIASSSLHEFDNKYFFKFLNDNVIKMVTLPKNVNSFIYHFDRNITDKAKPFEFEIDMDKAIVWNGE